MIYVGIDDTDILDYPGTNQLARHIARTLTNELQCRIIVRHQLLEDPRVPCTKKNGCAGMLFSCPPGASEFEVAEGLPARLRPLILDWAPEGSDPGLCVTTDVPLDVVEWGQRCQRELVTQQQARSLAQSHAIYLEGLGGTQDGVIGALAAVGLISTGDDGRIVYAGEFDGYEYLDLAGIHEPATILRHGIDEIRCLHTGAHFDTATNPSTSFLGAGQIDISNQLRPNYRNGRIVMFVERTDATAGRAAWQAVRLK